MKKIIIIDNKRAILTDKPLTEGVSQIHELSELENIAIERMTADEKLFAHCGADCFWKFKISTEEDMIEMFDGLTHLGVKFSYVEVLTCEEL